MKMVNAKDDNMPMIKGKMDLEVSIAKLKRLKAGYQNTQYQLQDKVLKIFPKQIAQLKEKINDIKNDIQTYSENPVEKDKFSSITIKGLFHLKKNFINSLHFLKNSLKFLRMMPKRIQPKSILLKKIQSVIYHRALKCNL